MIWNLVHQASREIKRQAQGSGGILLRVVVGFHTTLARTILSISQSKHILKSLVDFFFFFLLILSKQPLHSDRLLPVNLHPFR